LPQPIQVSVRVKQRLEQPPALAEVEAEYVKQVLAGAKGNKTEAARILGISRKNLYEKLARMKRRDEGGGLRDEDA
jgi:DNA-binding NtrC family response regulator